MVAVRCSFLFFLFFFFTFSPYLSLSLTEQEALLKFKGSLTNTAQLADWVLNPLPLSSPCKWEGVRCNPTGLVEVLNLPKMELSGIIDIQALTELKGLRFLHFNDNKFIGIIPDFKQLGALKILQINNNKFSGDIPENFFASMPSLTKVHLSKNNFTGNFPKSLTGLKTLKDIHLQDNQFTGEIPISLAELKSLESLYLQNNHFSGPIPDFKDSLRQLDVSNNNLTGEIPPDMKKYDAKSFEGNKGLCGGPLKKECKDNAPAPKASPPKESTTPEQKPTTNQSPPPKDDEKKSTSDNTMNIVIGVIVGVLVLLLLVLVIIIRQQSKQREDSFSVLGKEKMEEHVPQNHEEVVEVHVPSSNGRSMSGSTTAAAEEASRSGSSKKKGGSHSGKNAGNNDLTMVNDQRGTFGLADLMKAAAEILGNGGLGSAYKTVMGNRLSVVVKRMREMNRLGKEGFDAEMKRFGRLRHKNILTPLAYHYRKEEKLVISEYISKGSLLYVLHGDRGAFHSELTWPTRLRIIQGVASGMEFLHTEFVSYDLPHGNLKSSNILLNDDFEPVLNDYAFHPLINPTAQSIFAFKTPEYIESQQISPKSDVYCLGIVILEILTGKFPSQYLKNGKGGIDVVQWLQSATAEQREQELLDPEIESNAESVNQMLQLLKIGADCTQSEPDQRPDIREAIRRILEIQV